YDAEVAHGRAGLPIFCHLQRWNLHLARSYPLVRVGKEGRSIAIGELAEDGAGQAVDAASLTQRRSRCPLQSQIIAIEAEPEADNRALRQRGHRRRNGGLRSLIDNERVIDAEGSCRRVI